ncbi:MAG: outer membrane protein transport protein [Gammaproteobacteria bacterium]|nr:outer membrane protein transport protein [Gammaproteobacteria bacterium]MDH5800761.1 outer membrane protein transport protein [Gammaproteobacteria bacterium]
MKTPTMGLIKTSAILSTLALPGLAWSAGFSIVEQNVSGLGNAYAGSAAVSNDASTVFFNPAGMTQLNGNTGSFALHAITPSAKFSNGNTRYGGGGTVSGGNGGDAGGTELVPNAYYVTNIGSATKFGIGISAPYGLTTEYDKSWVGRYQAVKSQLKTVNFNPSLAFSVAGGWSLGFGMNLQYADATLSNVVDFGTISGNPAGSLDGFAEITGDSWAMGYNTGILFAPSQSAKIGFSYRSKVKHKLEGQSNFTIPAPLAATPIAIAFANSDATANLTLPETASLSSVQMVTPKIQLLGDITLTKWSRLNELKVEYSNPNTPTTVEEMHWKDTFKYSVGINYLANQNFTYRGGFAFDEGAAPNSTYRSPRVPDNDRTWLALGLGYKQGTMSFDFGYVHIMIDDTAINRTNALGQTLNGTYDLSVNIISAQVNYNF